MKLADTYRAARRNYFRAWGVISSWREAAYWRDANARANIANRARQCADAREAEALAYAGAEVEGISKNNAIQKAHAALLKFWRNVVPDRHATGPRVRRRIIAALA